MFSKKTTSGENYYASYTGNLLYDEDLMNDYDSKFIDELLKIPEVISIDIDRLENCNKYYIKCREDYSVDIVENKISNIYRNIINIMDINDRWNMIYIVYFGNGEIQNEKRNTFYWLVKK